MKKILLLAVVVLFSIVSCKSTSELPVSDSVIEEGSADMQKSVADQIDSSDVSDPVEIPVQSEVSESEIEPNLEGLSEIPVAAGESDIISDDSGLLPESVPEPELIEEPEIVSGSEPEILLIPSEPENPSNVEIPSESDGIGAAENQPGVEVLNDPIEIAPVDTLNTLPVASDTETVVQSEIVAPEHPEVIEETVVQPASVESSSSSESGQPQSVLPPLESTSEQSVPAPPTVVEDIPFVPIPSRSVTLGVRQYLDVQYPGSGWIYLGELESDGTDKKVPLLTYFGRQLNSSDTVFSLRAGKTGTSVLRFYKPDQLTGVYIDDYLAVTVSEQPVQSLQRVKAPSYAQIVPPAQNTVPAPVFAQSSEVDPAANSQKNISTADGSASQNKSGQVTQSAVSQSGGTGTAADAQQDTGFSTVIVQPPVQESAVQPVLQPDASVPSASDTAEQQKASEEPVMIPSDLLKQAQASFDAGEYEKAADLLDSFFASANTDIDRGLFLKGQLYETKSAIRNIRESVSAYSKLVQLYPQSPLWQQAKNRLTYLNRFYFNIR